MAENHHSVTPFNYVLNNPLKYMDFIGLDTINVNYSGYITGVVQADGEHVIMQNGVRLNFNDYNVDVQQLINMILPGNPYNYNYSKDRIRLFHNISDDEIMNYMVEAGALEHFFNMTTTSLLSTHLFYRYSKGALEGLGKYDFARTLFIKYGRANVAKDIGTVRPNYGGDQTGGFFTFGKHNIMYNLYDAGNFLTGKAFNTRVINYGK